MWRPSGRWRVPWLASVSRRSSRRTRMTDERITLEREDGLAILPLDYPPLNLVDAVTWDALDARTAELVADPTRDVLIRARSAERRVGKEGVSTCRYRWSPDNTKKQTIRQLHTMTKHNSI